MNDEELKKLWQAQTELSPPSPLPDTEIIAQMKNKMVRFDRTIFWRDVRELAACPVVAFSYAYLAMVSSTTMSRVGCLIVIASAIFIALEMLVTRRAQHKFQNPASIREFLRGELDKVNRQIWLLRNILWWYILPLFIGVEVYDLGRSKSVPDRVVNVFVLIVVGAVLYWVNQHAVRKTLLPLKQELDQTLNSTPEFLD